MSREIKDNTMVEVWSNYSSSLSYVTPKVVRTWHTPGSMKKVAMSELYEAVNAPGGKKFFDEGALLIKDNEVRDKLGLEPLDQYTLSREEIITLLEKKDIEKVEELLQYCSNMMLETIVQIAIDMPIEDRPIAKLIQSYSGTDVFQVIEEKAQDTEQPQAAQPEKGKPRPKRKIKE